MARPGVAGPAVAGRVVVVALVARWQVVVVGVAVVVARVARHYAPGGVAMVLAGLARPGVPAVLA
ncbi:MAG: peptidase M14, partial [Acidimicrobiales bacterium]